MNLITMLNRNNEGMSAMLGVFGVSMIAFTIAIAINITSATELKMSNNYYASVSSFYAAESCIEEALLKLRFDADYASPYNESSPLYIGNSNCFLNINPDIAEPRKGEVEAWGKNRRSRRSVMANYQDAGPSSERAPTEIMMVLDKSGSMGNDHDKNIVITGGYVWDALNNVYVWDPSVTGRQPISDAKNAAVRMILGMDSAFDQIGAVAYSTNASLLASLTNNHNQVVSQINTLEPNGWTNIGDAIKMATEEFTTDSSTHKFQILLTDGKANRPQEGSNAYDDAPYWVINDPETTLPRPVEHLPSFYALWRAEEAGVLGIIIFTISLGENTSQELMINIANTTGGQHYYAPSSEELDEIFDLIKAEIQTYEIKKTTWQEG